jgi:hypothetical protein
MLLLLLRRAVVLLHGLLANCCRMLKAILCPVERQQAMWQAERVIGHT